jgi:dienelactone hydrolase
MQFNRLFSACLLISALGVLVCCASKNLYPIGKADRYSIVEYGNDLPIFVYMPDSIPSEGAPIVVFNHGRPFSAVTEGKYQPDIYLASILQQNNIAAAFPVRSGYHSARGFDRERVSCNAPNYLQLLAAGKAAAKNVKEAIERVKRLPNINKNRIVVGGTSAGGFASINAIPLISDDVQGVFSLNGGRCGKRGKAINGLENIERIYRDIAEKSHVPVVFYAGTEDTTIPLYSTQRLYDAFCEARGKKCEGSVSLQIVSGANHRVFQMVSEAGDRIVQFVKKGQL